MFADVKQGINTAEAVPAAHGDFIGLNFDNPSLYGNSEIG
jgi:hypothetical protein